MIAICPSTSLIGIEDVDVFGTVSKPFSKDHSNIPPWVPKGVTYGADEPLLVGFDTEYQRQGNTNKILCYQFHAQLADREWNGIIYPRNGRRIRFRQFLAKAIEQGLSAGHLSDWPKAICLVGHFSFADLPAFADFSQFKNKFDSIRRTFVTMSRPMRVKVWDDQRHLHVVVVTLRDSYLLAPAGKRALKELSKLVGVDKVELAAGEIQHMEKLLAEDPNRNAGAEPRTRWRCRGAHHPVESWGESVVEDVGAIGH